MLPLLVVLGALGGNVGVGLLAPGLELGGDLTVAAVVLLIGQGGTLCRLLIPLNLVEPLIGAA